MSFEFKELRITPEMIDEARRRANDATTDLESLKRQFRAQQKKLIAEGLIDPNWRDTRGEKMPRAEQAEVRLFYVGFDGKNKNRIVDFIPFDNDVVWQRGWMWSDYPVSAEKERAMFEAVDPYRDLPSDEVSRAFVDIPCLHGDCPLTTRQRVVDVFAMEEQNDYVLDMEATQREGKPVFKHVWHEIIADFVCPTCKGENHLLNKWEQVCPAKFREGKDKTRVEFFPPTAWKAIVRWAENVKQSDRSLYVCGGTGVCKSRMMFQMLHDYVVPAGFRFNVFAGGEFRREQELIMQTRFDRYNRYISTADDVDVLVFDDFGQDDLNPSMLSNLRLLIDKRLSNGLRTIFLANVPPAGITSVYGNTMATQTLVRRIEDYCDVVHVGTSKPSLDEAIKRKRQKLAGEAVAVENIPTDESPF